jgi:hypothetical protein
MINVLCVKTFMFCRVDGTIKSVCTSKWARCFDKRNSFSETVGCRRNRNFFIIHVKEVGHHLRYILWSCSLGGIRLGYYQSFQYLITYFIKGMRLWPPRLQPWPQNNFGPPNIGPLRLQTPTRQQTPQHCPNPLLVGGLLSTKSAGNSPPTKIF